MLLCNNTTNWRLRLINRAVLRRCEKNGHGGLPAEGARPILDRMSTEEDLAGRFFALWAEYLTALSADPQMAEMHAPLGRDDAGGGWRCTAVTAPPFGLDRRLAPRPLPAHLASAMLLWLSCRAALTSLSNGLALSNKPGDRLSALAGEIRRSGPEAVGAALDRQLPRARRRLSEGPRNLPPPPVPTRRAACRNAAGSGALRGCSTTAPAAADRSCCWSRR